MTDKQLDMLDPLPAVRPTARRTDPPSAHLAARSAAPRAGSNRAKVLELLARADLTDYELADRAGLQQNSIGVRRSELTKAGYVEPLSLDGVPVDRPGPTGTACQVWRITAQGLAWVAAQAVADRAA